MKLNNQHLNVCDCGEYHTAAIRTRLQHGEIKCRNCSSNREAIERCKICQKIAPLESHHIYGRSQPDVISICLNCHAILTQANLAWQNDISLNWIGLTNLLALSHIRFNYNRFLTQTISG